MKKQLTLLILIFCVAALPLSAGGKVMKYQYYMLSYNTAELMTSIRSFAVQQEGYVKSFTGNRITIRVPETALARFKALMQSRSFIVDEQVYRNDVSETVLDLKTRLEAKKKLLADLYKLFEGSKFHQTLDIETEIGTVVMEIEQIKGELAYYDDLTELSEVTVDFNLKSRQGTSSPVFSKWEWIRKMGVNSMIETWNR
jgi:hypothetical protein